MRELTDSERETMVKAWANIRSERLDDEREWGFTEGFIAGLDHQQAQVAALQALVERVVEIGPALLDTDIPPDRTPKLEQLLSDLKEAVA